MLMNLKRMKLGQDYYLISRKLSKYDLVPEFLWTVEQKKEVVELLEKMFKLDVELEDYLIKDGDTEGLKTFKNNQAYVANRLWNLKQDLAKIGA